MLDNETRRLIGRLHRVEGQVRSLERQLEGDYLVGIGQFEAAIAALKSCMVEYALIAIADPGLTEEKRSKIIHRLVSGK